MLHRNFETFVSVLHTSPPIRDRRYLDCIIFLVALSVAVNTV